MPLHLTRLLAALGLLLQFALWFALAAGGLRLVRLSFAIVGEPDKATTDDTISEGAAYALLLIQAGQFLALSGLGLTAAAVWVGRLRERWVFWGGLLALAAWIPFAPFGTVLGLGGATALVLSRKHLLPPATSGPTHVR